MDRNGTRPQLTEDPKRPATIDPAPTPSVSAFHDSAFGVASPLEPPNSTNTAPAS